MINIILACHGKLASGIKNSLKILLGDESKYINTAELFEDTETESYYKTLEDKLIFNKNVINVIVIDLPGGTPSNQALVLSVNYQNVEVISTINLPLIIELLLSREEINNKKDLELILIKSKQTIKNLSEEFRNEVI